jgi:hypothetical protein
MRVATTLGELMGKKSLRSLGEDAGHKARDTRALELGQGGTVRVATTLDQLIGKKPLLSLGEERRDEDGFLRSGEAVEEKDPELSEWEHIGKDEDE